MQKVGVINHSVTNLMLSHIAMVVSAEARHAGFHVELFCKLITGLRRTLLLAQRFDSRCCLEEWHDSRLHHIEIVFGSWQLH